MIERQEFKEVFTNLRDSINKTKNSVNYHSVIANINYEELPTEVSNLIEGLLKSNDAYHETSLMLIDKLIQGADSLSAANERLQKAISLNSELIKRLTN